MTREARRHCSETVSSNRRLRIGGRLRRWRRLRHDYNWRRTFGKVPCSPDRLNWSGKDYQRRPD